MISFTKSTLKPASPDLTPLLDVVFILLIFFVVSTVYTAKGMNMDLPPAETAKPVSGKSLEIELKENGRILCNMQPVTLHELAHELRTVARKPSAMQPENILLKSVPQARVENFIRIVDIVRSEGFSNLVIVTANKKEDSGRKSR
ncbi:ExbD/TolR family protein [Maridesulfovibrio salexigens]|uniref:Biopolymer transport protein ExbD/TolR n=1 Tax=Maridesulfovibrio salexigens (strain ATCC 14822 / DSM 2638 / NCIMB 8403 / VKM B-1763) TaxID=526222 RepID=C6BWH6_MARSD|nr:biopolymer transporter ExbD [Maridesulfovibrio salexigens]ACS78420.1 Biopolymer transport protein ExbD/TolR [Maridesulfovibrio salexigens DSM 2638]